MKLLHIDLANDFAFGRRLALLVAKCSRGVSLQRATLADYIPSLRDTHVGAALINNDEYNETLINVCRSIIRQAPHLPIIFSHSRGVLGETQRETARQHGVVRIFPYEYYLSETDVRKILKEVIQHGVRKTLSGAALGQVLRVLSGNKESARLSVENAAGDRAWVYLAQGSICHAQLNPGTGGDSVAGHDVIRQLVSWEGEVSSMLLPRPLFPARCNIDISNGALFDLLGPPTNERGPFGGDSSFHQQLSGIAQTGTFHTVGSDPARSGHGASLASKIKEVLKQSQGPMGPALQRELLPKVAAIGSSLGLGEVLALEIQGDLGTRFHAVIGAIGTDDRGSKGSGRKKNDD
ncbi:DUF4388 domain-containing protein [Myxococcota bacterium]|nr:DUF4388 domain-containing protein [Myxococcota bacterium]